LSEEGEGVALGGVPTRQGTQQFLGIGAVADDGPRFLRVYCRFSIVASLYPFRGVILRWPVTERKGLL
jgi:hypothetical protein